MATIQEKITEVREMIGETIPPGGSDVNTMFTDERVTAWINGSSSLEGAALRGWRAKAAEFSNLVNVTDGAASREMSDLLKNALEMVKQYNGLSRGPAFGRTRVGKIIRP